MVKDGREIETCPWKEKYRGWKREEKKKE